MSHPIAEAIMEYAQVQACPVIDSNLMLVGTISDRDLTWVQHHRGFGGKDGHVCCKGRRPVDVGERIADHEQVLCRLLDLSFATF